MVSQSRFTGRRAPVTGASNGIGRAIAVRLAAEGAAVAVVDLRAEAARRVCEELRRLGVPAFAAAADGSDESAVAEAVDLAAIAFGGLDLAVSSAGIALGGQVHNLPVEQWRRVIDINLTGTFLTLKHALPHPMAQQSSAIVTVGSVAGLVAAGPVARYDASKGGVLQLTRAVAADYAAHGVRANCVCPGAVRTELMTNSARVGDVPVTGNAARVPRVAVPLDRPGTVEEIAGVVAFLCSDDAAYMTGAAVTVDGGFTAV